MSARVLHLIDTGGPGGAESVFADLAVGLEKSGWNSVAVVPSYGWLSNRAEKAGLQLELLAGKRPFDFAYLLRLVRLLKSTGIDLIQAHLLGSAVYGSLAGRICGIPAVCTFHGSVDFSGRSRVERLKFQFLNHPRVRVVFVSEALRSHVVHKTGIEKGCSAVIPNGIDPTADGLKRTEKFRTELGVKADDVLVGAVGNVRPAKDYGLLLEVAARLRDSSRRYRFVVVGEKDNALYRELRRKQERLGLERVVHFVGLRDDVPAILADLDVYLLTSSTEGFSLSTVEALASGLPVVATRCGGPEEIITHGVHGLLVEPKSARALAAALEEIAARPDRARRMAKRGRKRVEAEFTREQMVERYEALYETLLA